MLQGEYLGFRLEVAEIDIENEAFFEWCGKHELRLQRCDVCGLLRYPPTTACPWCGEPESTWEPVEGKGTLHSYGEVHHAILPQFRDHLPYMMVLVELDSQRDQPTPDEAIRFTGDLAEPDGSLASAETIRRAGIGSRLRVVFKDVGKGFAIPLWTLDESATQPAQPWRYPQE